MPETVEIDLLKRQFLAALNHEIRTPLSGILGMTNLLEQSNLSAEQREYVNLTKACADELHSVLSSTLEFTAMAAGDKTLDCGDFLLQDALEAIAAQWLIKARAKGLRFRLRIDDNLPETARGDELRFRKLLQHLLSNAVKFTANGEVSLEVACLPNPGDSGGFLLNVQVRDTGLGMTPNQISSIFDSFQQLDSGLARHYSGLGLGLSLAQGLTGLLGGDLKVQSEPGSGSLFSFTIPLLHSDLEPGFHRPEEKRILVVDDNEAARKVAAAYLKRGGYQVTLAISGEAALELTQAQHFDLIVMDLQMPGMDGIETTAQIRDIPAYTKTPILALTANSGDEYRLLCLSHGMQAYLPKPIESEHLLRTVRQLL